MNSNNRHRHAGHTTRPRSSPRLAHVALRHAGGPHSTSGRPPAPNACTRPQNPQHGGRASVRGVRVRSRTHRAAAALRARSARVPPPQQREGIGPTPTHRRNHTSARPQHVHTGRREGREATGGYAHRCEVVALLVASLAPPAPAEPAPPACETQKGWACAARLMHRYMVAGRVLAHPRAQASPYIDVAGRSTPPSHAPPSPSAAESPRPPRQHRVGVPCLYT